MGGYVNLFEARNALLLLLFGGITLSFIRMLISDRSRWSEPYYSALVAITVLFSMMAGERISLWVWTHYGDGNHEWLTAARVSVLVGFWTGMVVSSVCVLRVFTVRRFGHQLWVMVLLWSLAGAGLMTWVLP